jgi:sulfur transfer protein SufE
VTRGNMMQGLAALLVQGLSGCRPEDIIRIRPEFLDKLGLGQALTPSRNNGFLNMFKLMQAKSLQLLSG